MDELWTAKRFCRWQFELDDDAEPTKSQMNTIYYMCRSGSLPAVRVGREWRIDTGLYMKWVDDRLPKVWKERKHAIEKSGAA